MNLRMRGIGVLGVIMLALSASAPPAHATTPTAPVQPAAIAIAPLGQTAAVVAIAPVAPLLYLHVVGDLPTITWTVAKTAAIADAGNSPLALRTNSDNAIEASVNSRRHSTAIGNTPLTSYTGSHFARWYTHTMRHWSRLTPNI